MLSTESRMRGDMQVRFGGQVRENLLPKGSKAFCTEPTRRQGRKHLRPCRGVHQVGRLPYASEVCGGDVGYAASGT